MPAENASPQKASSVGAAGLGAAVGATMVATVEKIYAQGEPVSPQALLARFVHVPDV